ncbi:MAG: hypothetical protein Q9169_007231 [Polycauliona sp. 2 TL-2023]
MHGVYGNSDVTMFYVNSTNQLDCVDWESWHVKFWPCVVPYWPVITVALEANPISATILNSTEGEPGLLLVYQNATHHPAMLLGYIDTDTWEWTWRDETDQLSANIQDLMLKESTEGISLVDSSAVEPFSRSSYPPDKTSVTPVTTLPEPEGGVTVILLTGSELQIVSAVIPPPEQNLPFGHIAGTVSINPTKAYTYHQLDDSTFRENFWDGTSGIWIRNSITIDTE